MDVLNSVLIYFEKRWSLTHVILVRTCNGCSLRKEYCMHRFPAESNICYIVSLLENAVYTNSCFEMRFKTMVLFFSLQLNRRVLFTKGIQMEQPMYKSIL